VDRAALDVALALGLPCGGWCPAGRLAEDGAIPARYPLRETPSGDPAQRTAWNVRDSDATLVLARGIPRGGTALTLEQARLQQRPFRQADPFRDAAADARAWMSVGGFRTLNVAGPRESEQPGIYAAATGFLDRLLTRPPAFEVTE
jgi:hypothetical protein